MCSLRSSQNVPYCVEREHIREEINIFYTDGVGFFPGWTELGGRGGTGPPPSFLDLCSKNFKISQIWAENFFFYLVVPPHKKFASVHPGYKIYQKIEI